MPTATAMLTRDPSLDPIGTTSIVPFGSRSYDINSFFRNHADISLNTPTPLQRTVGPIDLVATPEPAGLAVLAHLSLLLITHRLRRQATPG
jgi:hypothetical protein